MSAIPDKIAYIDFQRISLSPRQLCETKNGDLAFTVGRLVLKPGRPMLVEHLGGVLIEHKLTGEVLTPGYDDGYTIAHIIDAVI